MTAPTMRSGMPPVAIGLYLFVPKLVGGLAGAPPGCNRPLRGELCCKVFRGTPRRQTTSPPAPSPDPNLAATIAAATAATATAVAIATTATSCTLLPSTAALLLPPPPQQEFDGIFTRVFTFVGQCTTLEYAASCAKFCVCYC